MRANRINYPAFHMLSQFCLAKKRIVSAFLHVTYICIRFGISGKRILRAFFYLRHPHTHCCVIQSQNFYFWTEESVSNLKKSKINTKEDDMINIQYTLFFINHVNVSSWVWYLLHFGAHVIHPKSRSPPYLGFSAIFWDEKPSSLDCG